MTPADRARIQARIRILEAALAGQPVARIAAEQRTTPQAVRRALRTAGWPDQDQMTAHIDALVHDRSEPTKLTWRQYVITNTERWMADRAPADRIVQWLGYSEPHTLARALRGWGRDDLADAVHRRQREKAA